MPCPLPRQSTGLVLLVVQGVILIPDTLSLPHVSDDELFFSEREADSDWS